MSSRSSFARIHRLAIGAAAVIFGVALLTLPALAQGQGNPPDAECDGLLFLVKFQTPENFDEATEEGVTLTLSEDGLTGSWTSTIGIDRVVVKFGNDNNVYNYDEAFSDSFETNGQNATSHVTFCYDEGEPSPSPSPEPSPSPSPEPSPSPSPEPSPSPSPEPSPSPSPEPSPSPAPEPSPSPSPTEAATVLGVVLDQPEQLPVTGTSSLLASLLGAGSIAFGGLLLVAESRLRHRESE